MKYGEDIQEGDTIEILNQPTSWADHITRFTKVYVHNPMYLLQYPVRGIILEKSIFNNPTFTIRKEFYCALIKIGDKVYGFNFRNKVNYKIINSKNNFNQSVI